jgi:hypothetical protein
MGSGCQEYDTEYEFWMSFHSQGVKNREPNKAHHRNFASPRISFGEQMEDIKMPVNIQLEPEAQEFVKATANPPYLFDLGPEKVANTAATRGAIALANDGPRQGFSAHP